MLLKFSLLLSMIFQMSAAIIAVSLIHRTKYNISWILISSGFVLMSVNRLIEFSSIFWETSIIEKEYVDNWICVFVSILMLLGLIFIRRIFNFQARIDEIRKNSEARLLSAIIQGEEKARLVIARDLHDGLGPLLSSIKMIISATDLEKLDQNNRKIIERSCLVTDEAIVSLKEISNHLSPHLLKNYGFTRAIETFAGQLLEDSRVKFKMITNIESRRFNYDIEISLYRIVTELLNNSAKHANAKNIRLGIFEKGNFIKLEYKDDGAGFSIENYQNESGYKGMGLGNIRSRIKSLNGQFFINTGPGKGITVFIQTPLK